MADDIEAAGIPVFVDRWQRLPLWQSQNQLDAATRDRLCQQRLKNDPVGLANSLRGMGTGKQPALWAALPDLDLPVILLVGQLDEKFVDINHKMAAYLPQATLHAVSGAGHTVHLERPSEFSELVMNWLG